MRNQKIEFSNIIANSRNLLKSHPEYKKKVMYIKNETYLKYSLKIKDENNIVKKLYLIVIRYWEIRKQIKKLTSFDKLF
jgi:hypothetical protein